MPTKKKADGRRNNGAESRGLTEDKQLVRGPREVIEAMRARAKADNTTISDAWRKAAEAYLRT